MRAFCRVDLARMAAKSTIIVSLAAMAELTGCATTVPQPELTASTRSLIAPVWDAYKRVKNEQQVMPPANGVADSLLRLESLDQVGRKAWRAIDLSQLPADQQKAAYDAVWREIRQHDLENQRALKSMLPSSGWFSETDYGKSVADAAFYIVQHASNDTSLQHDVLARMSVLMQKHEANGPDYALLYDRLALQDGKLQRYGTQMDCKSHKWVLAPLEDPAHADGRRQGVGIRTSLEKYVASFDSDPPCQ